MKLSRTSFISIVLFLGFVSSLSGENWVLASQEFKIKNKNIKESESQLTKVLPQLILEQFSENGLRLISSEEELDRELYKLQTERLSLFLQLSKEEKSRDALVLSKATPSELKKALSEAGKKIEDIESKISENLKLTEETKNKYQERISSEKQGLDIAEEHKSGFSFFQNDKNLLASELVSLYKSDNSALFTPGTQAAEDGISSYAFENEITAAKINGLLCGDITVFGEYCSVNVNLYVFPGAKNAGCVTEVGSINDLVSISQSVARKLTPKIANSKPVKLRFEIEPEEAREHALVSIDGVILGKEAVREEVIIDAGIHTVTVSSENYENQTVNYSFSGEEIFTVKTTLKPVVEGVSSIRLKKYREGLFSFNGAESSSINDQNPAGTVAINGRTVLGVFKNNEGETAFIMIPEKYSADGLNLLVNAKPFNREKNIDKRRKSMYTAYSVLVCSLVPTFYCVGNLNASVNAYNADRGSYSNAQKWQNYSYFSIGVSGVCGSWFVVELIRYLNAANEVLPAEAKKE